MAWLLLLAGLLAAIACVQAADVVIGGDGGWNNDQMYNPIYAKMGDVLVFNYKSGRHNVMQTSSLSCSALSQAKSLAATNDPTPIRVPLTAAGPTYYACSVEDPCDDGQLVQVNTT
ncbi:hypothetical protein WJX74_009235 [Apatococcus lobatus]|uniref:Phytocyanin domain-containing protein n=1 Tax=Apatococcus lobatus TaxID=904363 RepID=A0AAW1QN95_9CHLO